MTDTLPHVQKRYEDMILSLPWERRLEMGTELFDTGMELLKMGVPKNLSEKEKKLEIFSKMYKEDFTSEKFEMWFKKYKEYLDTTE
jgi:exonuclease VII small subunit